jgi:hypothetical protein
VAERSGGVLGVRGRTHRKQKAPTHRPDRRLRMMRSLVTALVLCGLGAPLAAAGSPPPPPPRFWSVSRCERVLHKHDLIPTAQGYVFHVGQLICVGTGAPRACRWTPGRRSRLYSEFRVFGRTRYIGSIVRSWTLFTRGGHGLVGVGQPGGDQYAGWPPAFYVSPTSVRLLAASSTPAGFRSLIGPITARLVQQENATGCTGA